MNSALERNTTMIQLTLDFNPITEKLVKEIMSKMKTQRVEQVALEECIHKRYGFAL